MASIVKRGNSYSVVYMTSIQGQRKQKWETYHSLDEAPRSLFEQDNCISRYRNDQSYNWHSSLWQIQPYETDGTAFA